MWMDTDKTGIATEDTVKRHSPPRSPSLAEQKSTGGSRSFTVSYDQGGIDLSCATACAPPEGPRYLSPPQGYLVNHTIGNIQGGQDRSSPSLTLERGTEGVS